MTAVKHGATVANYCEVTDLHKDSNGKLNGARVKDNLTGEEFNVRAKVRVHFCDMTISNSTCRVLSTQPDLSLTLS